MHLCSSVKNYTVNLFMAHELSGQQQYIYNVYNVQYYMSALYSLVVLLIRRLSKYQHRKCHCGGF